jgi:hypothetical protein
LSDLGQQPPESNGGCEEESRLINPLLGGDLQQMIQEFVSE